MVLHNGKQLSTTDNNSNTPFFMIGNSKMGHNGKKFTTTDNNSNTPFLFYYRKEHRAWHNGKRFTTKVMLHFYFIIGDSMSYHNGKQFSTKDKDNDSDPRNCAIIY